MLSAVSCNTDCTVSAPLRGCGTPKQCCPLRLGHVLECLGCRWGQARHTWGRSSDSNGSFQQRCSCLYLVLTTFLIHPFPPHTCSMNAIIEGKYYINTKMNKPCPKYWHSVSKLQPYLHPMQQWTTSLLYIPLVGRSRAVSVGAAISSSSRVSIVFGNTLALLCAWTRRSAACWRWCRCRVWCFLRFERTARNIRVGKQDIARENFQLLDRFYFQHQSTWWQEITDCSGKFGVFGIGKKSILISEKSFKNVPEST